MGKIKTFEEHNYNMKKAYIVKLKDADNRAYHLTYKLVDQETWDWIMNPSTGEPKNKNKSNIFNEMWDDPFCPDSIRDRIGDKTDFRLNPKEVLISGFIENGHLNVSNDRAVLAPPLEDDYDVFEHYYATSKIIKEMLKIAKQRGYDVDLNNQYLGIMY